MNVNYSNLTSRADCQFLIREMETQKRSLANELERLRIKDDKIEYRSQSRHSQILRLTADLASTENTLLTATGSDREFFLEKKIDLEYKIGKLNRRSNVNSAVADVERDYDIGVLEAQFNATVEFIDGLTIHMNAIPE